MSTYRCYGKRILMIISIFWLVSALITPGAASTLEEVLEYQEDLINVEELERSARSNGGSAEYGASLEEGVCGLVEMAVEEFGGIFREAARSAVILMVILLLCGATEAMWGAIGGVSVNAVPLAGALAVTAVAVTDVNSLLGLGRTMIEGTRSFANILLPAAAAVSAATGAITGAAVRQMAAVLFSDLLINLIEGILVPLLYGYIMLSVVHAATGNEGLKRLAVLLKWGATTILTVVMIAFVSYLSLSGVVSGGADAAAVKAAKFAISSTIPVVGGILSDAAETILASAGVLKGTIGVFGAVSILGICLIPLLRIAVHYLLYKLVSALAAVTGKSEVSDLVDRIGGAFGLLMGMTGACSLLLLIALVSSVTAVSL